MLSPLSSGCRPHYRLMAGPKIDESWWVKSHASCVPRRSDFPRIFTSGGSAGRTLLQLGEQPSRGMIDRGGLQGLLELAVIRTR